MTTTHNSELNLLIPEHGFGKCWIEYSIEPREMEVAYYRVSKITFKDQELDVEQMLRLNGDMQREILKARQGEFASRELKMDADEIGSKPKVKPQSTDRDDGQLPLL